MSGFDHVAICVGRGWGIVASLIVVLSAVSNPRGAARREALHLVRVAEATMRRMFILMALPLKLSTPRVVAAERPDFSSFATTAHPAARFALTEALAAWPSLRDSGPRIRVLEYDAYPVALAAAGPASEHDLATRIAALQNAFEHRARHARRMAKWIARARARSGPGRFYALRAGRPPGYSRRRRTRDPAVQDSLMDLHGFAWRALASP